MLFGGFLTPVHLQAESNLSTFSVLQESKALGGYRAANGSSVNISGTDEIGDQVMIGVGKRHV